MESNEILQRRLEYWVQEEQVALRALMYAREQIKETNKMIELARTTGIFVVNGFEHGVEDIGYYGDAENRRNGT